MSEKLFESFKIHLTQQKLLLRLISVSKKCTLGVSKIRYSIKQKTLSDNFIIQGTAPSHASAKATQVQQTIDV